MRIFLIGLNHRTAPVAIRERVAFTQEQAARAITGLRALGILQEGVILSTCNRSELYGVPAIDEQFPEEALRIHFAQFHNLRPEELNGALYVQSGQKAIQHLYRVAAGLDSMLLGEAEILGQVRDSYLFALESGLTGPFLNRLFQGALAAGKRVRTETELGVGPMSAAYAAVKLAEQIFGGLRDHRALIIGAGAMGEQVVEYMCKRKLSNVLVANRSNERALELAGRFHGQAIVWQDLLNALAQPDILISAAGGTEIIINKASVERAMVQRSNRPLFAMDLGVPRTIEATCGDLYNVFLYNIDDLTGIVEQNKKAREREVPRAEAILEDQIRKLTQWEAGAQRASAAARRGEDSLCEKGST